MNLDLSKIVRTVILENEPRISRYSLPSGTYVDLLNSPFQNCQTYTLGYAEGVFSYDNYGDILAYIHEYTLKNQICLDLRSKFTSKVESFFPKEDIVFKAPYTNKTGTEMVMWLIRTPKLSLMARTNMLKKQEEEKKKALEESKDGQKAKEVVEQVISEPGYIWRADFGAGYEFPTIK